MSSAGRADRIARVARVCAIACLCACSSGDDAPVRVTVPPGASMRIAADSLKRAGVIGSPKLFRLYAKLRGSDRGIKAGTYMLKPSAGWGAVLSALRDGRGIVNTVTIPEGFRLEQITQVLVSKLGVPPESVTAAVRDTALLRRLAVPVADAEGYLFPDTYFFPPGTTARVAVGTMVRRFETKFKPEWGARADSMGVSRHAVMTLASIVEREARLPQERPVIAAVYWNRLRKGMLLQADPTVQYALPQYQKRLLNRHLAVQSKYNTYKYAGLPPGPIASPGAASIDATLHPANVPFLYFVAHPDGHHEFRATLEQHKAAADLAHKLWALERRKAAAQKTPPTPSKAR